ncbi:DUF803-domain-containing protein [Auriculariales sp. MPI-PUGE-AT-0066]|nr:DUF803-domain-containing protein [Auriculariales sp. MPI-PUGE-AT-0066]
MSSTTSSVASATSSASDGSLPQLPSSFKIVGILLAITSGLLIGSSFVFKKKGLLAAGPSATEGGVAYLKSPLWWTGMTMMIIGEICNFAAYAFVEALVVTPLGALSVVICAILSSIFLKETLTFFGWLGCALCIIGSTVIALNTPPEATVGQIREFQKLFLAPGFLGWTGFVIAASLTIMFHFGPKYVLAFRFEECADGMRSSVFERSSSGDSLIYGKDSMFWYIAVCSMIGGLSVSVTTGLGASIVTSVRGDNQFKYWFIYFLLGFVVVTLLTEVYYLNLALALFNTAMVTPTYYVCFTFCTLVTTIILFKGLKAPATDIITLVMGFLVICIGITILQMSKVDPTKLEKLDRRSTILLQAARSKTEMAEKDTAEAIEEPGLDTLRGGGFGAVGSFIRARSQRRLSMQSHASGNKYRARPPGAMDPLAHMTRHQLYDPPMPGRENVDDISLQSKAPSHSFVDMASPSPRRQTIKFGDEQVTHMYPTDRAHGGSAIHATSPMPESRPAFTYDDPYSDEHAIDDSSLVTPGRKPAKPGKKYPVNEDNGEEQLSLVRGADTNPFTDASAGGVRLVQKRTNMI